MIPDLTQEGPGTGASLKPFIWGAQGRNTLLASYTTTWLFHGEVKKEAESLSAAATDMALWTCGRHRAHVCQQQLSPTRRTSVTMFAPDVCSFAEGGYCLPLEVQPLVVSFLVSDLSVILQVVSCAVTSFRGISFSDPWLKSF